jgi:shikimate kinase
MSDGQVFDFRTPASQVAPSAWELTCPVFFVGFMGAGKTSTARKLARLAGCAAIDMDTYIERRCGMKVKEIFAEVGEEGFRSIETDILRELAAGESQLISCGGGVVLAPENRQILKEGGCVVYLKVTAQEAASRISNVASRPLFGNLENAQHVLEGRLPLYEEVADICIETAGRGTGLIAREAFQLLKKEGIIWQPR